MRIRYIFAKRDPAESISLTAWLRIAHAIPLLPLPAKIFHSPLNGLPLATDLPHSFAAAEKGRNHIIWRTDEMRAPGGYLELQGDGARFNELADQIAIAIDGVIVDELSDY